MLKYYLDQKPLSISDIEIMRKNKQKFTDEFFQPNDSSLFSKNEEGFLDKHLGKEIVYILMSSLKYKPTWMRISDMPELNKIYDENDFSFDCILQGAIGDCYLISELCQISLYPKLLVNSDK